MRFLLISNYAPFVVNFRGVLIADLLSKGVEVHVAAPHIEGSPDVVQILVEQGVVVHGFKLSRAGLNPFIDILTLFQLFALMLRIRPDVVMGYTIKPVIYGSIAAFFAGVPRRFALITGLGYAFNDNSRAGAVKKLVRFLYRVGLSSVHKVFFQNPDDELLFRSSKILSNSSLTLVVNGSGVDIDKFVVTPIPQGPVSFLLIARLLADKGVREYVEAARRIRKDRPDIVFGVVGWVDENPNAVAQTELDEWISNNTIKYYGRLKDVRPAIAETSVFVLPSYREGTPRTVLEAMAMGRPVVTTDAPGCRETVIDGYNGFLVPIKSVDQLVAAMVRFIRSPELVSKMGDNAREIAVNKYDVKKVNAIMINAMDII